MHIRTLKHVCLIYFYKAWDTGSCQDFIHHHLACLRGTQEGESGTEEQEFHVDLEFLIIQQSFISVKGRLCSRENVRVIESI